MKTRKAKTKRKAGHYWVKHDTKGWGIAYWCKSEYWVLPGLVSPIADHGFLEIDETPIQKNPWPVLSDSERKAFEKSGSKTIMFEQTGIGTAVSYKMKNGKWKNITDYNNW